MRYQDRQARAATALIFFLTGAVFAAWSTRLPAIKEPLGRSDGALAVAILGLEAGAVAGLPLGGALVARAGSRTALRASFAVYPLGLVAVALATGVATLAAALTAMALANSIVDVAMNGQGVELERRFGRPLLSGLHAGHSLGLAAGGLAGTLAAAAGVPVMAHFAATAALGAGPGVGARPGLPGRGPRRGGRDPAARGAPGGRRAPVRAPARPARTARARRLLRLPPGRHGLQLDRRPAALRARRRPRPRRRRVHALRTVPGRRAAGRRAPPAPP